MDQTSLLPVLSGFQRFQLTITWIKNGRQGNREEWIKQVCVAKKIEYTLPVRVTR